MATSHELLHANLHDVFGNRDAATRRATIDAIFTEDVVFTDPEETVSGRDALEHKAAGLLSAVPESFAFAADGIEYVGADTAALAWTFGPPDAPVARGIDIITITAGRISALHTLLHEEASAAE